VYAPKLGRWVCPACYLNADRGRIATGVAHAVNPARPARRHAALQRRQSQAAPNDEDTDADLDG
jgi:hypothetical protein